MSVSGQEICRLAQQASEASTPEEALTILRALRDELREFERQHVARALTLGEPVTNVATALGVSRQSAHRRFRDLVPPRAAAYRMLPSPEARLAVEYARREACALGAPAVGGVHLLLGILCSGDSETVRSLERLGVTIDAARTAAATLAPAHTTRDGLDAETKAALAVAHRAAVQEQVRTVGLTHLLAGALHKPDGSAAVLLGMLGVSTEHACLP